MHARNFWFIVRSVDFRILSSLCYLRAHPYFLLHSFFRGGWECSTHMHQFPLIQGQKTNTGGSEEGSWDNTGTNAS